MCINKTMLLGLLVLFLNQALGIGLYRPHILRTMRGEMALAENAPVIEDTIKPQLFYDPDTIKVHGLKSVAVAYLFNVACTALPPAMGFIIGSAGAEYGWDFWSYAFGAPALCVGPSAGLFYAGKWIKGGVSLLLRIPLVALGSATMGMLLIEFEEGSQLKTASYFVFPISLGLYIYTVVNDCKITKQSIEKHNEELRLQFFHKLEQNQQKVGLGFSWNF